MHACALCASPSVGALCDACGDNLADEIYQHGNLSRSTKARIVSGAQHRTGPRSPGANDSLRAQAETFAIAVGSAGFKMADLAENARRAMAAPGAQNPPSTARKPQSRIDRLEF